MLPLLASADSEQIVGWSVYLILMIDLAFVVWILHLKKDSLAAMSWTLTVLLMPIFGAILFILIGFQSIHRPIRRKQLHTLRYRARPSGSGEFRTLDAVKTSPGWEGISELSLKLGAFQPMGGNHVEQFHEVALAYQNMFAAIRGAKHHIHLQMFIIRPDETGRKVMTLLAEKAREGVQVRVLHDAIGSWNFSASVIRILTDAGGKVAAFLPISLLRRRVQINLRNHRKILVVDGKIAFTGGLNLGDEYLGKNPFFGPWRDTAIRIEGPAVSSLQRIFLEDWNFATKEELPLEVYFPVYQKMGDVTVQIACSGPDQELKTIREIYFAAITRAKKRIWIASPYFVPDVALLNALALAGRSGVDVRLLCPFRPDKWIPYLAARFYWQVMLPAGVKIYQYTPGFIHAKNMLIDDVWSCIGTANFDNRSLFLNFEVNCQIESEEVAKQLEAAFLKDFEKSIRLEEVGFNNRPFVGRVAENACRLLSPIL